MKDQYGRSIDYLRVSVTDAVICAVCTACQRTEWNGFRMRRF